MIDMTNLVIKADILPEPLFSLVQAEKIRVLENDGVITMTPIKEEYDCTAEVRGMYSDKKLTLDKFLERKHADKELEH
jgi:ribosomal protein L21